MTEGIGKNELIAHFTNVLILKNLGQAALQNYLKLTIFLLIIRGGGVI